MGDYEKNCTILIGKDKSNLPSVAELQKKIEQPNDSVKAKALEEAIIGIIDGEQSYAKLLMCVIRFVVPSNHHRVKKLAQIYFEIVDKCKSDGSLKEEMILVCNALRNDLMSSNEYVRGSTLRLLCKIRYQKILEPLLDPILKNLTHRHSYVRRNAVMCVYSIVKSFGLEVVPQAAEEVEKLLLTESDLSTKRNAFLMLLQCDHERAMGYVLSVQDVVTGQGDIFQLVLLELLRKVCRQNPAQKALLLRLIMTIVESAAPAVAYDCAGSLVALSGSQAALKFASSAYVKLLVSQSDINVKLIVLDRLCEVLVKHKGVLEGFVMDILRALSCPSLEVRRKTLDIALKLVGPRSVVDLVNVLKKEIVKSMEMDTQLLPTTLEYRRMLIRGIHTSCSKFPEVAQSVMHLLMDFLAEADTTTSTEVVMFVRELVARYPSMRPTVMSRIVEALHEIQQSRVVRVCLWTLGEFCDDPDEIVSVLSCLHNSIKPLPLTTLVDKIDKSAITATSPKIKVTTRTVILEDGTYGREDVYQEGTVSPTETHKHSYVRELLVGGDLLLSAMLVVATTKVFFRAYDLKVLTNKCSNGTLYMIASVLAFVKGQQRSGDTAARIAQCLKAVLLLLSRDSRTNEAKCRQIATVRNEFLSGCRSALEKVLTIESDNQSVHISDDNTDTEVRNEPDDAIVFRQLRERRGGVSDVLQDEDLDVQNAVGRGSVDDNDDAALFQLRLQKVQPMTGLADPVYVEAFLQVYQFDLVVELIVINRTSETLQNVNVELSTHGDLKLVDRPASVNLGVGETSCLKASIKVQSTETGIIFGYVTYDKRSAAMKEYLVLNELHIDLLEYIQRSWIGELSFRTMWSEFEWENKINIHTSITDVGVFLQHLMKQTNMTVVGKCAKPPASAQKLKQHKITSIGGSGVGGGVGRDEVDEYMETVRGMSSLRKLTANSSFFAINLYSKSIFGEDALANLSIEKLPDGKLAGSVRIRSRTQGIALSLGDRITVVQRGLYN
eukprot:GHVQ01006993.1.p1 GENE.GHVQ01006993.1~~GHVQ01006993.1.p1  ORF type:complete len:1006 (-),score=118.11 GHVQ01006993.1:766-3783(-)